VEEIVLCLEAEPPAIHIFASIAAGLNGR